MEERLLKVFGTASPRFQSWKAKESRSSDNCGEEGSFSSEVIVRKEEKGATPGGGRETCRPGGEGIGLGEEGCGEGGGKRGDEEGGGRRRRWLSRRCGD
eukprot:761802-Hanusia_phi.AAC.5